MKIQITDTTTVGDIQQEFHKAYPFLKIEFADRPHLSGMGNRSAHWYRPEFKLSTISKKAPAGFITINPWCKTGLLEELLQREFGLYAQVFRLEGADWIETAGTDVFTLDEQNYIGQHFSWRMTGDSPTAAANLL